MKCYGCDVEKMVVLGRRVAPDRSIRFEEVVKHFEERIYGSPEDASTEAKRIWRQTGFPRGGYVECGSSSK